MQLSVVTAGTDELQVKGYQKCITAVYVKMRRGSNPGRENVNGNATCRFYGLKIIENYISSRIMLNTVLFYLILNK